MKPDLCNLPTLSGASRLNVISSASGCGKTTLGRQLAEHMGMPFCEIDAIHWLSNWTECPLEIFRERVTEVAQGERWVIDGNYSRVRDIVWARAQAVVWLDYRLGVAVARLFRRTLKRFVTQEQLWNGNREHLGAILGRDSLLLFTLRTYKRRRQDLNRLLSQPEYAHLVVVRLSSPRATEEWLSREIGPVPPRALGC